MRDDSTDFALRPESMIGCERGVWLQRAAANRVNPAATTKLTTYHKRSVGQFLRMLSRVPFRPFTSLNIAISTVTEGHLHL
jgi:hypothetical protein